MYLYPAIPFVQYIVFNQLCGTLDSSRRIETLYVIILLLYLLVSYSVTGEVDG
jgi:hypothetical protein